MILVENLYYSVAYDSTLTFNAQENPIELGVQQNGIEVSTVYSDGGVGEAFVVLGESNSKGVFSYDCSKSQVLPISNSNTELFQFNPKELSEGLYQLSVEITSADDDSINLSLINENTLKTHGGSNSGEGFLVEDGDFLYLLGIFA
tara:strand:- start:118 stop:555 length:438 start_codon:yes stop_codon:yes gene_type:complete